MNTKIHILILFLVSLSLDASNQNFSHTISTEERNETRDNLFLYNKSCILAIHEFLSDPAVNNNLETQIKHALEKNRRGVFIQIICGKHNALIAALIPQIAKFFNIKEQRFIQNYRNQTGMSLLSMACTNFLLYSPYCKVEVEYNDKKLHFFRYLIENKVDVDSQDTNGDTAIHHAIQHPRSAAFEQIEMLVKEGRANINIQNNKGETPLLAATSRMVYEESEQNYDLKVALKLLGADINIKNNDGKTADDILKSKYPHKEITKEVLVMMSPAEKRKLWKKSTP